MEKILKQMGSKILRKGIIVKSEKLYRYNYYIYRKDFIKAFKYHPLLYIKNCGNMDERLQQK